MEIRNCLICKKGIRVGSWDVKNGRGKYCSKQCQYLGFKDSGHPGWKGDSVTKDALHIWLHRKIKKPELCQKCYEVPPYDLANISQKYKRDLSDWEWLCRKCHMNDDGRINKRDARGRYYA